MFVDLLNAMANQRVFKLEIHSSLKMSVFVQCWVMFTLANPFSSTNNDTMQVSDSLCSVDNFIDFNGTL